MRNIAPKDAAAVVETREWSSRSITSCKSRGPVKVAHLQRVTRPLRQRGLISTRTSAHHERARQDWIEIPVPALSSILRPSDAEQ
jgi:hypothetical protein